MPTSMQLISPNPDKNGVLSDEYKQFTLESLREEFGPSKVDEDGRVVCGQVKQGYTEDDEDALCRSDAGSGTVHLGVGPCSRHGGQVPSKNAIAPVPTSVKINYKAPRLRQLMDIEMARDDINNIDGEIQSTRALANFIMEMVGVETEQIDTGEVDEDDNPIYEYRTRTVQDLKILRQHAQEVIRLQSLVPTMVEKKFSILNIVKSLVSRTEVQAWASNVDTAIQQHVRNTCSKCGHQHGTLDRLLDALSLIRL